MDEAAVETPTIPIAGLIGIAVASLMVYIVHKMLGSHVHDNSPQRMIIGLEIVAFVTIIVGVVIDEVFYVASHVSGGSGETSIATKFIIVFGALIASLAIYIGATHLIQWLKKR